MSRPSVARPVWSALSRVWDHLLGRPAGFTSPPSPPVSLPVRLNLLPLEERVVPTGRPLPQPFLFAGAGAGAPPRVSAFNAETGELKFEKQPFDSTFTGGVRVAAGDLDHDGLPDLIAAAGPGGGPHVRVYSGATGDQIAGPLGSFMAYDTTFSGGVWVASGDVDGDGWADLVTAAGAGGSPHVRVWSGQTGADLFNFYAYAPSFGGGATIACVDLTGDGRAEVITGAGAGGTAHVRVFDLNASGGPTDVRNFLAYDSSFTGGVEIGSDALAGDVTGDGLPDLVTGAGAGGGPHVKVFDGASGAEVHSFMAFDTSFTGGVTVATAFVDDDQFADLIVGSGPGMAGTVKVFSGVDASELPSPMSPYQPFGSGYTGGVYVAGSNDPDAVFMSLSGPYTAATGGTVALTATVNDGNLFNGYQVPTGPVRFTANDGSGRVDVGVATLAATGTAGQAAVVLQVNPLPLAAGSYTMEAFYDGDSWFLSGAVVLLGSMTVSAPSTPPTPTITRRPSTATSGAVVAAPGAGTTGPVAQACGVGADGDVVVNMACQVGGGIGSTAAGGVGDVSVRFTNATGYTDSLVKAGLGVTVTGMPRLTQQAGNTQVAMIDGAGAALWFDGPSGGTYTTPFGHPATLVANGGTGELELTDGAGDVLSFYDFSGGTPSGRAGRLKRRVDAAGNSADVVSWDGSGRPTELQVTDPSGAVESLVSAYDGSGYLTSVTRRRKPSGGSFSTVRVVEYSYATLGSDQVLEWTTEKDGSANVLAESFNRYYTTTAGTGYAGGLKYHLGAEAVARVKAAFSGTALTALTDGQIDDYADVALQYDPANQRATQVVRAGAGCSACSGGQGTSVMYYAVNASPGSGVNDWVSKVACTLDDGTPHVSYANKYGEELLGITTNPATGQSWFTYTQYDSTGRVILQANPSAVTGYDESLSDLVGWSGGSATHLRSGDGLISTTTYGSSTTATTSTAGDVSGSVKSTAIQRGTGGTAIPQGEVTYIGRTANSQTRYHVAGSTQYRNDNGTGGQTTSYAYTWQGSTAQIASVTTTLPTVTSGQNGPNSATSSVVEFDAVGRPIWAKDAAGVLSYTAYDVQTGAVVKSIADVNTANTGDFTALPSGWSATGLHLISEYEADALGRTTKSVDPLGQIAYTVYDDINKATRTYAGWTGSATTGPTVVTRDDWAGGYTEILTMSATPTTSSSKPTGAESISSIQSLSRSYRNTAGQTVYSDSYFDLTGVTYSTAANIGTQNTNFYRTEQGYDKQGRANRSVSAAGTITRTEYDSLGRAVSTWVGTDDTPTSGVWSTTNLTGTNMVKVSETEYDGGGVGDSNATRQSGYPGGGAAARESQTWYDWRDRAVGTKSGVEASEATDVNRPLQYTEYDNLGTAVVSESYDGDTVSLTDGNSDGVPDRPSSSLLRAKSVTSTDELGRVYKSEVYAVDPSSGSVSTYALTSQAWYDLRGLTLKTSSPGGLVTKTAYDALGRAVTVYSSDGGGDSGYSDADDVSGDTVLSQSETTYDADGRTILRVTRERFHDATDTGALGNPASTSGTAKARVSYSAAYYDLANRVTDTLNVGTNGGSSWSRPGSVPSRSDQELVTSTVYDSAGRTWKVTDPRGLESRTTYDLLGRTLKTVENYVNGTVSDADDKTTEYTYSAAGMTSLTAKLTGGGGQTTEWVYGVTQSGGSGLNSNDIVGATKWPDPSTGAASSGQQETVLVNALGQPLVTTDRNGSVHTLTYDILGRVVVDTVTTLGSGVDASVRRVETAYDGQGNAYLLTSYSATTSGSIVAQTQRAYNGLGQLTREWQSRGAAVNTSTSPSVQYAYSTLNTDNRSRLTSVTYPSGYVLTYNYASGINSDVSRLSSLSDTSGTLESYDYLGLSTVVKRGHPQSGVDQTFILQVPESTADAGDQYIGLDRFGRVADQRWRSSSDVDRTQYAYDRDGNRVTRTNTVNSSYSEAYTYDGLNQIATFNRNSGARTQAWDYDAVGNWDSLTTNGGSPQTRTHNAQNEVTAVSGATSPTFDANGNMTTDETGKQYVYDAWNRLAAVKNSGGTTLKTYTCDALGRRVAETAGGTTTDLHYSSEWQVLEEAVSGVTKARYVWSPVYVDAMVLRDRDADNNAGTGTNGLEERLWVMQDANWNVTGLVNGSGTVVERYAYDPFGAATVMNGSWTVGSSAYGWVYLYQGRPLDATSGLYQIRGREYSPTVGRWVSLDPIRYEAGDVNLYRAIGNSPNNNTDPSGLADGWDHFWGAVKGAGIGFMIAGPPGPLAGGIVGGVWGPDPAVGNRIDGVGRIIGGVYLTIGTGGLLGIIGGDQVVAGVRDVIDGTHHQSGGAQLIDGIFGPGHGDFYDFGIQIVAIVPAVGPGVAGRFRPPPRIGGVPRPAPATPRPAPTVEPIPPQRPNPDVVGPPGNTSQPRPVFGRAPEFPGGRVTQSGFLRSAEQYLGNGYREVSPGRWVSADGLRQVRFGAHETRGPGLHGHFEAYDRAGGRVIENTRVDIIPD